MQEEEENQPPRKTVMKKSSTYFPFIVFFILIVSGVLYQKSKTPSPKEVLKIALPTDVSTFHLAFNTSSSIINAANVIPLLFEGLMRRGANDTPQTALAEKVTISKDGKQYVFSLKESIWSDGHPVTAYDFEYAWKRSIDPQSKVLILSPYYYYPIKNAKLCMEGKVPIEKVGVQAINEKILLVDLDYPSPYFLEIISSPMYLPAPKHIAENNENWSKKANFVCNGPFTLTTWKQGNEIILSNNECYWDKKHVYLDEIRFLIMPDTQTVLNLFIRKELDWIGSPFQGISYDISHDLIDKWVDDTIISCILINVEKYPLNNKKLRQALFHALDRKAITDNVFQLAATPTISSLPLPLSLRKTALEPYTATYAKKLFQEALEELQLLPKDFPPMTLSYIANIEIAGRIAQAVQDQWRQVLGIKNISLLSREYINHYASLTNKNFDLGLTNWTTFVFDPIFILNDFKDKTLPMNKTNWEHPHYKKLLDLSDQTLDFTKRRSFLQEAEQLLIDEAPLIPISSLNKRFAKNPRLQGEVLSKLQFVDFKSAYFNENLKYKKTKDNETKDLFVETIHTLEK